jgi:hypothetical protein
MAKNGKVLAEAQILLGLPYFKECLANTSLLLLPLLLESSAAHSAFAAVTAFY